MGVGCMGIKPMLGSTSQGPYSPRPRPLGLYPITLGAILKNRPFKGFEWAMLLVRLNGG
jgi:hypothetical protein